MSMLIEVTKEEFYRAIFKLNLNVHPRPECDVTYWETPNRELIGKTTPGYMCTGPKTHFLRPDIAHRAGITNVDGAPDERNET